MSRTGDAPSRGKRMLRSERGKLSSRRMTDEPLARDGRAAPGHTCCARTRRDHPSGILISDRRRRLRERPLTHSEIAGTHPERRATEPAEVARVDSNPVRYTITDRALVEASGSGTSSVRWYAGPRRPVPLNVAI